MTAAYGPYSPVREASGLLFVSGQIGVNSTNGNAPKGVAAQTERALLNLEDALAKAGASLDDIVKTTVFLTDMGNFEAVNAIYEQRFSTPRPARSTVGVKELPHVAGDAELLVEIEAVALKPGAHA
ncbi:MAG TPA: Rid family detoxifying hydrolase [Verrucomicrobiae bacterium]|nr:Rid family detoxifying hydrolase [Verrucomicrobiae bacterium]